MKASHILAIILGLEGTGKTTFVESLKTMGRVRPLFRYARQMIRQATQKELDGTTSTEGMEVSVFVDKFRHTVHFVDYAGQAVFAVAHDLLSTRLVTPMVAFVAVNATESKEEVEWRLREAAATLIGRKVPSGKSGWDVLFYSSCTAGFQLVNFQRLAITLCKEFTSNHMQCVSLALGL